MFKVYHDGFKHQSASWPLNPLDGFIAYVKKLPSGSVVADMGCGEARLAAEVFAERGSEVKIHSFDLVACNERVTACNISKVRLSRVPALSFATKTNFRDVLRRSH